MHNTCTIEHRTQIPEIPRHTYYLSVKISEFQKGLFSIILIKRIFQDRSLQDCFADLPLTQVHLVLENHLPKRKPHRVHSFAPFRSLRSATLRSFIHTVWPYTRKLARKR